MSNSNHKMSNKSNITKWIKEVSDGWRSEKDMTEQEIAIAKERLAICMDCEHLSDMIYRKCLLCYCPVIRKTRSMTSECKAQKWKSINVNKS